MAAEPFAWHTHRMATRSAAGLALLLVVALLVAAPGTAPAASDDLTAEQLCDLFPQDQGFTFTEAPGLNKCEGSKGDCDQSTTDLTTCVSGIVIQQVTAEEARGMVPAAGDGVWEALPGLGETAVGACDPFWCEVRLQRDRFWLSVLVAPGLGLEGAQALAADVDRAIEQVLGGGEPGGPGEEPEEPGEEPGGEPQEPGGEPQEPGNGEPDPSGLSDAFVDVFYGNAQIQALMPGARRILGCPDSTHRFGCNEVAEGILIGLATDFEEMFSAPAERQREGFMACAMATVMAGFETEDGRVLFPGLRAAMPVIRRLSDPGVAQRFVEMVAARDAADWERRGLG